MREIKFRVFYKGTFTYFDLNLLNDESRAFYDNEIKDNQVMQYTGLKDKQGVGIYEGDIVRVTDDLGDYGIGEVVFNLCSFCLEWIDDTESNIEPMITVKKINLNQEIEVIGNIYENKELLVWLGINKIWVFTDISVLKLKLELDLHL